MAVLLYLYVLDLGNVTRIIMLQQLFIMPAYALMLPLYYYAPA